MAEVENKKPGRKPRATPATKQSQYEKVKDAILARMNDAIDCKFDDDAKTVHFKTIKISQSRDPKKRIRVSFENSLNLGGVSASDVDYLLERARIFG